MDGLARWTDFHVAVAGAGAALGGLLVVALSIGVRQVAGSRGPAARAAAAVAAVMVGVVLAAVALMPGLSLPGYGVVALVGAALAGAAALATTRRVLLGGEGVPSRGRPADALPVVLLALPVLAYFVGGVLLTAGVTGGVVAVAVGMLTALVGAVVLTGVALVAVLR